MNYARISKVSALSLAIFSALALPAFAADNTADSSVKTKDVVVTATKTEAEVKAVPQAVEVIDSEDIQRMGANDVLTALSLADNLNLSRAGMTGNAVSLRGMSTNHTLVLIDGKRQAAEDTDVTTNVYALQRLNVSDIDRIEIVRGPSSALYGSEAMGGVINIITKTPTEAGGKVGVVTSTRNQATYINVDTGKKGRWSTSFDARFDKIRALTRDANTPLTTVSGTTTMNGKEYDYTMSTKTEGTSQSMYGMRRTYHLNSTYDFENQNQNKLRFDFDYMNEDLSSDYADTYIKMQIGKMPFPMFEKWSSKDKKEWFHNTSKGASVEYTGKTGRNEYQFRTYYNQLEKKSNLINYPINYPSISNKLTPMNQTFEPDMDYAKYKTWVTEAKDTMYIGDNHNLTFGGEYRKLDYEGTRLGGSPIGLDKVIKEKSVNSYAGYIEDMWQVNDKLLLIPSVRFEHNSQFGSETTPKIGATYNINNTWRFKANYGRGYKAPTLSELYMEMHRSMGNDVNVYGNPDLQPEETLSYDFGVEMDNGTTFGKLTYFNNKVTNLINTQQITKDSDDYKYVNINKAQINGIEAELGRRFGDRWTFKVNHNWLDAMDKIENTRLNNRARNMTTFQLIYDDHKPTGISAVLWDQFASDYRYNDVNYTYNTVNFSINKKWSTDFSTYAGVDNIFDKVVDDLYIDGREWRVGAEWKF